VATRLLITGGAGFIGANLVAELSARGGYAITVLDDLSAGCRERLATHDVRLHVADLRDRAALATALAGQDAVVHLAARTSVIDSVADPEADFDVNVRGSLVLLEAARAAGVHRIVAASSGGTVVGADQPPAHEGQVPRPRSPYGAGKLAMEGYLAAYAGSYGMTTCALRFANVYGPLSERKGSVVAAFFRRLLRGEELVVHGDGTQVRDYIYVGDVVAGIRQALESRASGVYQLGTGRPTTLNELLAVMAATVGQRKLPVRHAPARAGEVHATWCDIRRARAAFGFAPATGLREGLGRTWTWFKAREPALAAGAAVPASDGAYSPTTMS